MATCKITKDPNNKWFLVVDWTDWINGLVDSIGGTVDITNSEWFLETGLTKDAATPIVDDNYKCYLYATGGTDGQKYNVLNRITYNPSALAPIDFTEDRTLTVKIQEK